MPTELIDVRDLRRQHWVPLALAAAGMFCAAAVLPAQEQPTANPPEERPEPAPQESPADPQQTTPPAATQDSPASPPAPVAGEQEAALRPRMQLHVPSLRRLVQEIDRSHSGVFLRRILQIFHELATESAEGVDVAAADALAEQVGAWPDTSVIVDLYAPDTEGCSRWALTLDWPIAQLAQRTGSLLHTPEAQILLENLRLETRTSELHVLALAGTELARLQGLGEARSMVCSHGDLEHFPPPAVERDEDLTGEPLLTSRLHFGGTEADSGATFFSSFRIMTHVDYSAVVREDGSWSEKFELFWPPISGLGAKVMFDKVDQTFFVPGEAFGSAVFSSMAIPGALDSTLGFGPQVIMTEPGQMEVMGEAAAGPVASMIKAEACLAVLPGSGFFPVPDLIVQARLDRDAQAADAVRSAIDKINQEFTQRDQEPPWHEVTVRERAVFWRDPATFAPGVTMPVSMRPVIFQTRERDDRDRERDILVAAWTSTSPERVVRRWLDFPRGEGRNVPSRRKTNGQVWLNWKQLYKFIVPNVNVGLSSMLRGALLPAAGEIAAQLTDAEISIRLGFTGVSIKHVGPLPAGCAALPVMVTLATEESGAADSDLSRERLACRRLKVLYHHCQLFKKDLGRWPAEITELDGYVDFEGHPQLLRLQVSSKKRWDEWVENLFGGEDSAKDDEHSEDAEEDDLAAQRELAEDLYVIEWGRDAWRLGYVPGTLEHLERLYIDQDGVIHRVERPAASPQPPAPAAPAAPGPESTAPPAPAEPESDTQAKEPSQE